MPLDSLSILGSLQTESLPSSPGAAFLPRAPQRAEPQREGPRQTTPETGMKFSALADGQLFERHYLLKVLSSYTLNTGVSGGSLMGGLLRRDVRAEQNLPALVGWDRLTDVSTLRCIVNKVICSAVVPVTVRRASAIIDN